VDPPSASGLRPSAIPHGRGMQESHQIAAGSLLHTPLKSEVHDLLRHNRESRYGSSKPSSNSRSSLCCCGDLTIPATANRSALNRYRVAGRRKAHQRKVRREKAKAGKATLPSRGTAEESYDELGGSAVRRVVPRACGWLCVIPLHRDFVPLPSP
jgi:hypothetical protein